MQLYRDSVGSPGYISEQIGLPKQDLIRELRLCGIEPDFSEETVQEELAYTVGKTEAMKAVEKYVLMDGTGYNRSEVPLMNAVPRQFFASSEKAQITPRN